MNRILKIGSRGSPLALRHVEMVRAALSVQFPDLQTELVVIRTSGDWSPSDGEVRLSEAAGGKAQFAKEIEAALLAGEIDCAVHSMKDMDSVLPDGLVLKHMLPREDVRDCLLFSGERGRVRADGGIKAIPHGAVVGTASVRRRAVLLAARPDLKIVPLRGNVQTRIDKVRAGQVDVSLLALAGLKRLGLAHEADVVLDINDMLPSAGQGAVGIEARCDDDAVLSIFGQISCAKTVLCVSCEREVLRVLDGSCHTPIGVYAAIDGGQVSLRIQVNSLDGDACYKDSARFDAADMDRALECVRESARDFAFAFKAQIPDDIFQASLPAGA
ncbi:MAG: hydroxymethylbilane synthase [Bdellovibrionales bacterium]